VYAHARAPPQIHSSNVCVCVLVPVYVCAVTQPPGPSSRSHYNPPTISLSLTKEPYFHHIQEINVKQSTQFLTHRSPPSHSALTFPPRKPSSISRQKAICATKEPSISRKRALFLPKKSPQSQQHYSPRQRASLVSHKRIPSPPQKTPISLTKEPYSSHKIAATYCNTLSERE